MPRPASLALLLAACARAPAEPPPPAEQVCATMRNMKACCALDGRATPAVFATRAACDAAHDCKEVARVEADYTTHDVVLVTPATLQLTYADTDPSSLGDEWQLFRGLTVACTTPSGASFRLTARADAGGGTVVYAAAVPKLAGAAPTCGCAP
ncbi:MAG: hypothetical protein HY908_02665 [Myxococcales bacterium]|nr:hypothetical protein [Myxococcales bacterium]